MSNTNCSQKIAEAMFERVHTVQNLNEHYSMKPNGRAEAVKKSIVHEETRIIVGKDVLELLNNTEFLTNWEALCNTCPWATVFQSKEFVSSWYRFYHTDYFPILVLRTDGAKLTGLFTLAKDADNNITGAGASQAEYQVWLAPSHDGSEFIRKALSDIRKKFPKCSIKLKYVPVAAPIEWTEDDLVWKKLCFKRCVNHPLLIINKDHLAGELRKKNRREKINRLKRLGELRFEKITDTKTFASILDELAIQSDFRKGAMYNKSIFQSEPLRKKFLSSLFDQNILHVSLLWLDKKIIASNVGITGNGWVHLQGINTHSPSYAKYSPGILHFLMLCNTLAEEDIKVFDLTPGADAYKDALATDSTIAFELIISSQLKVARNALSYRLTEYSKSKLLKAGIQLSTLKRLKFNISLLKAKAGSIKARELKSYVQELISKNVSLGRLISYRLATHIKPAHNNTPIIKIDNLSDLLHYQSKGTVTTKWEFLIDAMKRFEVGQHSYTWSEDKCLIACVWLSKPHTFQTIGIPDEAAVLQGFYFHPSAQKQLRNFMEAVVSEITKSNAETILYAVTNTQYKNLCKVLETF